MRIEIIAILFLWIGLAWVVAEVAHRRGHSRVGYFVAALLLSPLIAGIAVAVAGPSAEGLLRSGRMKQCPECTGLLNSEAATCGSCGHEFSEDGLGPAGIKELHRGASLVSKFDWGIGALIAAVAVLLVYALSWDSGRRAAPAELPKPAPAAQSKSRQGVTSGVRKRLQQQREALPEQYLGTVQVKCGAGCDVYLFARGLRPGVSRFRSPEEARAYLAKTVALPPALAENLVAEAREKGRAEFGGLHWSRARALKLGLTPQ